MYNLRINYSKPQIISFLTVNIYVYQTLHLYI